MKTTLFSTTLIVLSTLIGCTQAEQDIPLTTTPLSPTPASLSTPSREADVTLSASFDGISFTVPLSSSPSLDGLLNPGEWDKAVRQEFNGNGELYLMHNGENLFLGIHQDGEDHIITTVFLGYDEEIFALHSSGSLGTAIFKQGEDGWQLTDPFTWELYGVTTHTITAERQRQVFFERNGWLANLGSMTDTGEIEYQITIPGAQFSIAVAYLQPPDFNRASWWPSELTDDCLNVNFLQGNSGENLDIPLSLQFLPETWTLFTIP